MIVAWQFTARECKSASAMESLTLQMLTKEAIGSEMLRSFGASRATPKILFTGLLGVAIWAEK
jgi:hypothetical protein